MRISEARQAAYMEEVTAYFRAVAPYKTGNLALNAIFNERIAPGEWIIGVSGKPKDLGVAPYMPYTNEPWIKPRGNPPRVLKNPNEGWWNRACEHAMEMFANLLKGQLRR